MPFNSMCCSIPFGFLLTVVSVTITRKLHLDNGITSSVCRFKSTFEFW